MRKVIVNSTPLIALCKVNQLELLRELYTEITIPEAVFQEVTAKNDSVKRKILENGAWIHVQSVSDTIDRRMYKAKLHDGEVEVMILAQEIKADLVIIDDNAARKTAIYLSLLPPKFRGNLFISKKCEETAEIQLFPRIFHLKIQFALGRSSFRAADFLLSAAFSCPCSPSNRSLSGTIVHFAGQSFT